MGNTKDKKQRNNKAFASPSLPSLPPLPSSIANSRHSIAQSSKCILNEVYQAIVTSVYQNIIPGFNTAVYFLEVTQLSALIEIQHDLDLDFDLNHDQRVPDRDVRAVLQFLMIMMRKMRHQRRSRQQRRPHAEFQSRTQFPSFSPPPLVPPPHLQLSASSYYDYN